MPSNSAHKHLMKLFEHSARREAGKWERKLIAEIERLAAAPPSEGTMADRRIPSSQDGTAFHDHKRQIALELACSQPSKSLLAAFKEAGLDETNPVHWRALLGMFARAHFDRKSGAPKKWTSERCCQLLHDAAQMKSRNSRLTDRGVCMLLARNNPAYRDLTPEWLRKTLRDARDPSKNKALAILALQYDFQGRSGENAAQLDRPEPIRAALNDIAERWPDYRWAA
jgi:hypothetical protein